MPLKLFRSTINVTYYTLAEKWQEADGFADDAIRDYNLPDCIDTEVTDGHFAKSDGYTVNSLVYHSGTEDISLKDALRVVAESNAIDDRTPASGVPDHRIVGQHLNEGTKP